MTQWDYQNKGKLGWTGKSSFVLEVPLRYLRPSVIYSIPCDWILQRAYPYISLHSCSCNCAVQHICCTVTVVAVMAHCSLG